MKIYSDVYSDLWRATQAHEEYLQPPIWNSMHILSHRHLGGRYHIGELIQSPSAAGTLYNIYWMLTKPLLNASIHGELNNSQADHPFSPEKLSCQKIIY